MYPLQVKSQGEISLGAFWSLSGQIAYVAEGRGIPRLNLVTSDLTVACGSSSTTVRKTTSSNVRYNALHRDERRALILASESGTLFGDSLDEEDIKSGTIYVLRSKSSHPFIAEHRELIHKIGVTGGDVESRNCRSRKGRHLPACRC